MFMNYAIKKQKERKGNMSLYEKYKNLTKEDKDNAILYAIYNSIIEISKDNNVELSEKEIERIQSQSYDLYIEDDYYKLSPIAISDFITQCYIDNNEFLDKIDLLKYEYIYDAIKNNDYDFYKDDEMER